MKAHCFVRQLVSIFAIACSTAALATPPQGADSRAVQLDRVTASQAGPGSASLTIDCARPVRPSQGEFARLTGIANHGQAYAARTTVMANVMRACHGADLVRVIGKPQPQTDQALATR